jgi:hypothetical protein
VLSERLHIFPLAYFCHLLTSEAQPFVEEDPCPPCGVGPIPIEGTSQRPEEGRLAQPCIKQWITDLSTSSPRINN